MREFNEKLSRRKQAIW